MRLGCPARLALEVVRLHLELSGCHPIRVTIPASAIDSSWPSWTRTGAARLRRRRCSTSLPPLAAAKLAAPRQREGLVARPRLTHTFDAGADAALTLVSAPPGYGKTTAVRVWCAASATAWAWVTLDGHDNDPARLWTYAATAVDRVREGLGRRALQRLRVAGMPVEIAVDELMNGIAAYGRELALVLDDCHAVTERRMPCLAPVRGRAASAQRASDPAALAPILRSGSLNFGPAGHWPSYVPASLLSQGRRLASCWSFEVGCACKTAMWTFS